MSAEYGMGYQLLAAMGYVGGGCAPLAAWRRPDRAALQDFEEPWVERVAVPAKKRRRRMAAGTQVVGVKVRRKRPCSSQGEAWAGGSRYRQLDSGGHGCAGDVSSGSGDEEQVDGSGRRRRHGRRRQQRLRPSSFTLRFVLGRRRRRCRVTPSVRQLRTRCQSRRRRRRRELSSSSSRAPANSARPPTPRPQWHCHGCSGTFPSRALLCEHVQERLVARTTRDPLDFSRSLDAEHFDGEALVAVASAGALPAASSWRCIACGATGSGHATGGSIKSLLEHVFSMAAAGSLAHRRVVRLTAELLLREPPPRPRASMGYCEELAGWAQHAVSLATLLHGFAAPIGTEVAVAVAEYRCLEEEVLGVDEEDMFGAG
eukprot:NODE_10689_length_1335_cov_3.368377.p1 GENE.NODE_10689_length_1335_cov_3.368377~~NODE_10689_length_1335_cov_3.368377.p1  ORF type:complete len:372 (+),score=85.44 NODE_10689_length_1335_cov_3.368377:2-1117(+)